MRIYSYLNHKKMNDLWLMVAWGNKRTTAQTSAVRFALCNPSLTATLTAETMIRHGIQWTQWDDDPALLVQITRSSTPWKTFLKLAVTRSITLLSCPILELSNLERTRCPHQAGSASFANARLRFLSCIHDIAILAIPEIALLAQVFDYFTT